MFDAGKKEQTLEILSGLCFHCGDKHTDECPLAKAMAAVKSIPTEEKAKQSFFSKIASLFKN